MNRLILICLLLLSWAQLPAQQFPEAPVIQKGANQNPNAKGKRWHWGGNFSLLLGDPLVVGASPTWMYELSPRLQVGVGGNYQYVKEKEEPTSQTIYGGSALCQYQVVDWAYLVAEYEAVNTLNQQENKRVWQQSPLLGAGVSVKLTQQLKLNLSMVRDFNYQPATTPFPSPWRFRFGFTI